MKRPILLLTILFALGPGTFLLLRSPAADKEDNVQELFEAARTSLMWNNELAGLLRSNQVELVQSMLSLRVAYEVASIKDLQSKLDPSDIQKAREMYLDAYPTLKPIENSTNVSSMPRKYREALKIYFEEMQNSVKLPTSPQNGL